MSEPSGTSIAYIYIYIYNANGQRATTTVTPASGSALEGALARWATICWRRSR